MIRLQPYTPSIHDQLHSFLFARKKTCVSFLERHPSFLKEKKQDAKRCFLLRKESGELCGAVFFSPSGLLFHCLPYAENNAFREAAGALLMPLLTEYAVFCVSGGLRGTKYLDELCASARFQTLEARDFHLMEYAPQNRDTRIAHNVPVIIECAPEHEDSLYALRKAYELAEVFPPGIEFVESVCRKNLRRHLAEKRIFAIPNYARQGEFMAMAAVNGMAKGITQIGGVYTDPQFRSRGYAKALIRHLAGRAHHENQECVLFVRKNNASAIHSYESAGFVKTGQYAITYYRPRQ